MNGETSARVLVAEDEPLIAMELQELLEIAGHHVLGPMRSCRDCLSLLQTTRPDVAIVDHQLLDGDAGPAIACLRQLDIPVIVLSGYSAAQITAGIHAWIEKPFTAADILDAVARVWPGPHPIASA